MTIRTAAMLFAAILILPLPGSGEAEGAAPNTLAAGATASIRIQHWTIAKDPLPNESLPSIPDSSWKPFLASDDYATGNWIIRSDVRIDPGVQSDTLLGLFPQAYITAYELYWDGVLIGRNGILGTDRTTEKAGTYRYYAPIPSELTKPGIPRSCSTPHSR